MKRLSKILAVALSLVLVMGIFPITAWATEADSESETAILNDTPYEEPLKSGTSLRDTRLRAALDPAIKLIFLEN